MGALVYILLMLNVLHWFCAVCTGSTEQQKQGSLVYFFMRTAAKFVLNDSQWDKYPGTQTFDIHGKE